jgi:hypothetical protein
MLEQLILEPNPARVNTPVVAELLESWLCYHLVLISRDTGDQLTTDKCYVWRKQLITFCFLLMLYFVIYQVCYARKSLCPNEALYAACSHAVMPCHWAWYANTKSKIFYKPKRAISRPTSNVTTDGVIIKYYHPLSECHLICNTCWFTTASQTS